MAFLGDILNYFSLSKAQEEQAKLDKESIQLGKDTLDWNKQAQETQWQREDTAISRQLADAQKNGINPLVALGKSGFDSSTNLLDSSALQQSMQASGEHKVNYAQMKFQNAMSIVNATVGTMENISKLSETIRHNKELENGMNWVNKAMNERVFPLIDNLLDKFKIGTDSKEKQLVIDSVGVDPDEDPKLALDKQLQKDKEEKQRKKREESAQKHNEKSMKSSVSELEKIHGKAYYHSFPNGKGGIWKFADGFELRD